ncbi:hypothetical protein BT96DRAFT_324769 [Gymnopus androsaceus JB14]|uniref:Uncharacterized protein n=1 Tax=Gymnopus androsaceus JB14 TaxID=1447944 RepID=A0A6A4GZY3_9AGAR|nr:hypothetical protein BT96DRAFT_324769 [Gymnopus androsaceus JB14]
MSDAMGIESKISGHRNQSMSYYCIATRILAVYIFSWMWISLSAIDDSHPSLRFAKIDQLDLHCDGPGSPQGQ